MKTKVIFRKEYDGEILAVLPYEIENKNGYCSCYAKGLQTSCAYDRIIKNTKPVTLLDSFEIESLKKDLNDAGYKLVVILKRSKKLFNKVYSQIFS